MDGPRDTTIGGADYLNPNWTAAGRMHDWRNYISDDLKKMWQTFTPEQRAAIARNADEQAGDENWDW
jgi:hypothetical protein